MRSPSIQRRLMITIASTFAFSILVVLVVIYVTARVNDVSIVTVSSSSSAEDIVQVTGPPATPDEGPWLVMIAALASIGLVALTAGWLISRKAFDRLRGMSQMAAALDERRTDIRFETTGNNDEIDQMAAAMNGALDRIASGLERQKQFVRTASHELRTPLTIARSSLEIPLVEGRIPTDVRSDVEQALAAQTRLESLLDSLLAVARSESLSVESVSLDDEIRAIIESVQQTSTLHALTWEVDLRPVQAQVSSTLLHSALRNIIGNAAMHNAEDGWVRISLRNAAGTAIVSVENTGHPLDDQELALLQQPFVKRDGSPGSGLGLAIAERAIAALNGSWRLSARAQGGLVVQVELPPTPHDSTRRTC